MQKNKKSRTQGTSNEENSADDIQPAAKKAPAKKNSTKAGATDQPQGKKSNEGNEVTASSPKAKSGNKSKTSASRKNSTNKADAEVNVNAGGVPLEKSPGGTNVENNPSLPGAGGRISNEDREAIIASVDADAEKQTGRPTGAIYGSGEDIISVQNPAGSAEAAQETVAYARVYGLIQTSDKAVYLSQGSIPEGQLQLVGQPNDQAFQGQVSGYNEQFVTVLGEYQAQGNSKSSSFVVRSIASHNDIARRAYELSEASDNSPEDNWIKAENELLGQS
jgi:hypothetical protein